MDKHQLDSDKAINDLSKNMKVALHEGHSALKLEFAEAKGNDGAPKQ